MQFVGDIPPQSVTQGPGLIEVLPSYDGAVFIAGL